MTGYFRINDTAGLGRAIAQQLGANEGLEGFCIYRDTSAVRRNVGDMPITTFQNQDRNYNLQHVIGTALS